MICDFLFGSLDEVIVMVDPDKTARAEEIFKKFNGRQIAKRTGLHSFTPDGFCFNPDADESNRVMLSYLIDSKHHVALLDDLSGENIAGFNRHNPLYSRPYSIKQRIAAWYQQVISEEVLQ